jgi:hypothetical protein
MRHRAGQLPGDGGRREGLAAGWRVQRLGCGQFLNFRAEDLGGGRRPGQDALVQPP